MKFKIGYKIKVIKDNWNKNILGKTGKIIGHHGHNIVKIEFDENMGGHNCDGCCKHGYGWNIEKDDIVLINREITNWKKIIESDKKRCD